jgi:hypothetical protein
MAVGDETKGYCPTCSGEKFAKIAATHEDRWDDGDATGWSEINILQCQGCKTTYVQRVETCSEDIEHFVEEDGSWGVVHTPTKTYWPAPSKRARPSWAHELTVDHDLWVLHNELYSALDGDMRVLAAIGVRTTFDRASELLGIDPALPFEEKLNGLVAEGKIGADERENLTVLADAGGAAAHRGWRPTPEQLDTLMTTLEAFLHRTLILGEALKVLKSSVPEKQKRRNAK